MSVMEEGNVHNTFSLSHFANESDSYQKDSFLIKMLPSKIKH